MKLPARQLPNRTIEAVVASAVVGLGVATLINGALARRAERRNPPKGTFVDVNGVRLHYVEKGSGSPVVLLHGNQSMGDDFDISGVLDLIAQKHRIIVFDRPGFGHSDRPRETVWTASAQASLIRKALRQLGVERPVVVGHSWGALVAATYAVDYPADTGAVLLLSGYYFPSTRLDVAMAKVATLPVLGDILRYTISPLMGWLTGPLFLKMVFGPSKVPERFKHEFPFSMALRPSQIRATNGDAALINSSAARLSGRYEGLAMPVAIMAGRGDKIVDIGWQPQWLHALVPQSTLQVLNGTGHMLHYEYPERVGETVEALCAAMRLDASLEQTVRQAAS